MGDFIICREKDENGEWKLIILRGSEPFSGMISTGRKMGEIEEFCNPDQLDELLNSTNLK